MQETRCDVFGTRRDIRTINFSVYFYAAVVSTAGCDAVVLESLEANVVAITRGLTARNGDGLCRQSNERLVGFIDGPTQLVPQTNEALYAIVLVDGHSSPVEMRQSDFVQITGLSHREPTQSLLVTSMQSVWSHVANPVAVRVPNEKKTTVKLINKWPSIRSNNPAEHVYAPDQYCVCVDNSSVLV